MQDLQDMCKIWCKILQDVHISCKTVFTGIEVHTWMYYGKMIESFELLYYVVSECCIFDGITSTSYMTEKIKVEKVKLYVSGIVLQ